nr:MAG TPA: hypothetical protein [Caudoviricetes sp.]DAR57126.1 MAG TPA: hypothetical protein [Caudoviricetes sp.]
MVYRAKVRYRSQRAVMLVCIKFVFSLNIFCSDTFAKVRK